MTRFPTSPRRHALSAVSLALMLCGCGQRPEAMLASARQYLAHNDQAAALIQIKNALQAQPDLAEARLLLGTALLANGDAVGAEAALRRALALKAPQDAVLPPLARALLAQGQAGKVSAEFARVHLADAQAQADLQLSLSRAYAQQDQGERAEALLQSSLQTVPDYAPALVEKARKAAAMGHMEEALTLVADVLHTRPRELAAWTLQGDIYSTMPGHADAAAGAYRQALDIQPNQMPVRNALILALLHKPDLDGARAELALLEKQAPDHPSTQYLQALLAFHQKDYAQAATRVQQSLQAAPHNVAALQLAGTIALELQQLPKAQAYLQETVMAAPDAMLARHLLALSYLRTHQTEKALQTLLPVLHQQPVSAPIAELAGEVYLALGQLDQAERYFTQAQQGQPSNARLQTALVTVRMQRNPADGSGVEALKKIAAADSGNSADWALINAHLQRHAWEPALAAIATLEKKQPGQAMAPYLRARVQLAMNNRAAARASLQQALEREPGYFAAVAALAALDVAEKRPQDARQRLEALLQKDPRHVPALLALAELAGASGAPRAEQAALYSRAVSANPQDLAARLQQVDFLLRMQDPKSAVAAAESALVAMPQEAGLLDALGRAQQAKGDPNQAMASFRALADRMPQSPLPPWRMANVQVALQDRDGAIQSLKRALALQPDYLEAQRALIGLYVAAKRPRDALALCRQIQTQRPADDSGYLLEADVLGAERQWDQAAESLRNAQKHTNSTLLAIRLHTVLQAAGKEAQASELATTWPQAHPSDAAFRFYLGDKAMEQGRMPQAEQHYAAVLALQPSNALALNNLAWVSARLKKDNAIGYAERAVALAPDQPAFLDTLASLHAARGAYPQALALQNKAVALQPNNPLLQLNRARIELGAGMKGAARQSLEALARLGDSFPQQAEVAALRRQVEQP